MVPHAERANTAAFLEEVITYIQALHKRVAELEARSSGLSPASAPPPASGSTRPPSPPAAPQPGPNPHAPAAVARHAGPGAEAGLPGALRAGQPGTPPAQHGSGEELSPATSEESVPHKKRKLGGEGA